jgi:hypothetical protein
LTAFFSKLGVVQATPFGMELVLHQLNVSKKEALLPVPVLEGKSTIRGQKLLDSHLDSYVPIFDISHYA